MIGITCALTNSNEDLITDNGVLKSISPKKLKLVVPKV
jgi:hypothetical protein